MNDDQKRRDFEEYVEAHKKAQYHRGRLEKSFQEYQKEEEDSLKERLERTRRPGFWKRLWVLLNRPLFCRREKEYTDALQVIADELESIKKLQEGKNELQGPESLDEDINSNITAAGTSGYVTITNYTHTVDPIHTHSTSGINMTFGVDFGGATGASFTASTGCMVTDSGWTYWNGEWRRTDEIPKCLVSTCSNRVKPGGEHCGLHAFP